MTAPFLPDHEVSGQPDAPWLILSNSLGSDRSLWDLQMPAFNAQFRVLRHDSRGQGKTPVSDPLSIEMLGKDVIALMDKHGIESAHFCGLSLGGLVGQWLALNHPDRIRRLVLCNTAAKIGSLETWTARADAVRQGGMAAIESMVLERWFTGWFGRHRKDRIAPILKTFLQSDAKGYAAACMAIAAADFRDDLGRIHQPTLVIAGAEDPATPPALSEALAAGIPHAALLVLDAAHISNVEQPGQFISAVLDFLAPDRVTEAARREAGLQVRKMVLGEAHVARSMDTTDPDALEFQELIAQLAWGTVWTRPGLKRRERSLLVLAMTIALNREEEFILHLRGSKNNGVTREEIRELIIQAAIYCGMPAANHAMRTARAFWAEEDKATGLSNPSNPSNP
jgi:3-oxoadipate enol-lactonase/4-carboxymuconolactone decarboxylase